MILWHGYSQFTMVFKACDFEVYKSDICDWIEYACQGGSWKVVTSFEGALPNRIKQLPLNDLFDLNNVKKVLMQSANQIPSLL
jgi:hypothetical protein